MEVGLDTSERLVKPPEMDVVTSGRIFKPSSAFKKKYLFISIMSVIIGWLLIVVTLWSSLFIAGAITGSGTGTLLQDALWTITQWYTVICGIILLTGILIVNAWINSIEYSVVGESGEAMPEIYVKSGIIDVTEKHVGFNAITNVSARAGPFDRIFGIGSVFIETAGSSSVQLGGILAPDIKIEGVTFFKELRDHIVREMRKTKGAYKLTTETGFGSERDIIATGDDLAIVLQEILRVLRRLDDKLDRLG